VSETKFHTNKKNSKCNVVLHISHGVAKKPTDESSLVPFPVETAESANLMTSINLEQCTYFSVLIPPRHAW